MAPLIHGVERIPKRVGELRQYFPNLYPRDKGGDYYVKALIGFDKSFDSIMETIGWDLKMKSAQIFENDLQVPDTSKAGWFLWSLDTMALKELEADLIVRMGHTLALRFGAINMAERTQFPVKEVPRAVYVETETGNQVKTARLLAKLYRKDQQQFPLNIKLRFCSDTNILSSAKSKQKGTRMAYLQRTFCANVKVLTTWGISDLDTKDRVMGKSIRDLILEVKSLKFPNKNLYLSVSSGHKNKAVTLLTVFPNMEEEADTRTSTLLPYLSFANPAERVSKYFTPDEVDRCKDCYWDPVTKQVTSPIDAAMNELADIALIDPEYIFDLPEDLQGATTEVTVTPPAADFDADSISTMRSAGASTRSNRSSRIRPEGRGTPGRTGGRISGRGGRGRGRGNPTNPTPNPVSNTERATATLISAGTSLSGTSSRSATSGVTMDELSIAESRIMIQVTEDNNRLLEHITDAQEALENRIDEQMQAFLASLTRMGATASGQAATIIPQTPTHTNHQSPPTTTNTYTTQNTNTNTDQATTTNTNPSPDTPATANLSGSNSNTHSTTPTPAASQRQVNPTNPNLTGDLSTVSGQGP
jgi:hypothetical protein